MEAAFKSRVEHAFGALRGFSTQSGSGSQLASVEASSPLARGANGGADSWSVRDVAIPCNQASRVVDESSGSESDEPCAARYEKFVKLAERGRKRRANEDDEALDGDNDWDEGRVAKRFRGPELEGIVSTADGAPEFEEDEESREVRLMVGMDQTLDFEEEEDEYDKVAVGREGASERMYMREIKGTTSGVDSSTIIPLVEPGVQRGAFGRDSRANHAAAAARLKEDDRNASTVNIDVAKMLASASSSTSTTDSLGVNTSMNGDLDPTGFSSPGYNIKNTSKSTSITNGILKPSSGRRSSNAAGDGSDGFVVADDFKDSSEQEDLPKGGASRSPVKKPKAKMVRFAVEDHVIHDEPVLRKEGENVSTSEYLLKEGMSNKDVERVLTGTTKRSNSSRVPDYVRNPSKYTHYTLDWSDEEDDNKANVAAFQTTWKMTHPPQTQEVESPMELPKSITFTPRGGGPANTRGGDAKPSTTSGGHHSQALLSFSEDVAVADSSGVADGGQKRVDVAVSSEAKAPRIFRRRARDDVDDNNVENATL